MSAILLLDGTGLVILAVLLRLYWAERRQLRAFVTDGVPPQGSAASTALQWAGLLHAQIPRRMDVPFLPWGAFDFLGGTPGGILRHGGCCSGISRLYIAGLDTLGIPATHVILYHTSGVARHCLTEVCVEGQRLVVDPLYGFYYVDRHGRAVSIEALRRGAPHRYRRLPRSSRDHYPQNDYHNFAFTQTKTANWTKTPVRRGLYWVLAHVTAGRIATLRRPAWTEWPQLVVAVGVTGTVLLLHLWLL